MNSELHNFSQNFIKERFMAVVSCISKGEPRSFICWYQSYDGSLYWKSRTESVHSKAFLDNANASMCIYDYAAAYPDDKNGVQILGIVRKVTDRLEMENVVNIFSEKFGEKVFQKNNIDELCDDNTQSTFYAFTPTRIKVVSKKLNVHMEEYSDFIL